MKITLVVVDDSLLIILTIPQTDQSLEMDLYKVYNLPALHPKLKIEVTTSWRESTWPFLKTGFMQLFQLQENSEFVKVQKGICDS